MPQGKEFFRFTIPIKPTSWNALARKNKWVYKNHSDFWKKVTLYAARKHRPKKPYEGKVSLVFEAGWRTKRAHDCDNIFAKPIIDMLKADGFFVDDDTRYIPEVVLRGSTDQKEDSLTVICYAYVPG